MAINIFIASRTITETVSNAKSAPIIPSSRPALSPRGCSSISLSLLPSWFGTPSAPGCEPFVPASRPPNSSWQTRYARHFPNFSWLPQKAILSPNSSLSGRTQKICGLSAWLREQKDGLLSNNTIEIVNNFQGKHVKTIMGLDEPQGPLYVPEFDKLFVANAGNGVVNVYDAKTWDLRKSISLGDESDTDNLRYDEATKRVFVGVVGGIAMIEPQQKPMSGTSRAAG